MFKRLFLAIFLLVIIGGLLVAIFAFKAFINGKIAYAMAHLPVPPVTVSTAKAGQAAWPVNLSAVGSLAAVQSVDLTAQISGNVTGIYFHSGKQVRRGQLLLQIDNSTQMAQLRVDQANLALARTNLARTVKLIKVRAAAQSQLDTYQANVATAMAQVQADNSTLAKLAIRAPFAGYLGLRQVSLGQFVAPGTSIVALNSWQPIYAVFSIPQNNIAALALGRKVTLRVNSFPGRIFSGKISAISSQVDVNSRNVQVQATFPNKMKLLKPGMFGDISVATGKVLHVTVVPALAVAYSTYGDYVYVVEKTGKGKKAVRTAREILVHPGSQRGDMVAILSGIKPGQTVITVGQIKLHPGAVVLINNSVKP